MRFHMRQTTRALTPYTITANIIRGTVAAATHATNYRLNWLIYKTTTN